MIGIVLAYIGWTAYSCMIPYQQTWIPCAAQRMPIMVSGPPAFVFTTGVNGSVELVVVTLTMVLLVVVSEWYGLWHLFFILASSPVSVTTKPTKVY